LPEFLQAAEQAHAARNLEYQYIMVGDRDERGETLQPAGKSFERLLFP